MTCKLYLFSLNGFYIMWLVRCIMEIDCFTSNYVNFSIIVTIHIRVLNIYGCGLIGLLPSIVIYCKLKFNMLYVTREAK